MIRWWSRKRKETWTVNYIPVYFNSDFSWEPWIPKRVLLRGHRIQRFGYAIETVSRSLFFWWEVSKRICKAGRRSSPSVSTWVVREEICCWLEIDIFGRRVIRGSVNWAILSSSWRDKANWFSAYGAILLFSRHSISVSSVSWLVMWLYCQVTLLETNILWCGSARQDFENSNHSTCSNKWNDGKRTSLQPTIWWMDIQAQHEIIRKGRFNTHEKWNPGLESLLAFKPQAVLLLSCTVVLLISLLNLPSKLPPAARCI